MLNICPPQAAVLWHAGQGIAAPGICVHLEAHARLLRLLHDVERPAARFRSTPRHWRQPQVDIAALYQNVRPSCTVQTQYVHVQDQPLGGQPLGF